MIKDLIFGTLKIDGWGIEVSKTVIAGLCYGLSIMGAKPEQCYRIQFGTMLFKANSNLPLSVV